MKYRGHESFSIRKDWLAKGIRKIDSFKKTELEAMDDLGLGKNMIKSLRYWLKATGITNDDAKKKVFELSELGKIIKDHDPYVQESDTLWLLHYMLSKNLDYATSWYYFFNEFNQNEFTVDDFITSIKKFDEMNNPKPAIENSLIKDFEILRKTYLSNSDATSTSTLEENDPESNTDCPFSELGLITQISKGVYKKGIPLKQNLSSLILLCVILDQAEIQNGKNEIKLSSLQNDKNNIGKIFNLDSILMLNLLSELENKNLLTIVRTAGLDVVRLKTKMTFLECVKEYYRELEND